MKEFKVAKGKEKTQQAKGERDTDTTRIKVYEWKKLSSLVIFSWKKLNQRHNLRSVVTSDYVWLILSFSSLYVGKG